jgi:dihydroorotase
MSVILIKNASIVNEDKVFISDVLVKDQRIDKISSSIDIDNCEVINAEGLFLIPGVIDSHVHFRQPGLIHKGDLFTESAAAVAGGVTSFMDMPNTKPNTTTIEALEEKFKLAQHLSLANYSFYFGVTKNNMDLCPRLDLEWVCGVTDDGLYFDHLDLLCNQLNELERLFQLYDGHLSLHCEVESEIERNFKISQNLFKGDIPFSEHSKIRSRKACVDAISSVLDFQKKHKIRLHILHVSCAEEVQLISDAKKEKKTAPF